MSNIDVTLPAFHGPAWYVLAVSALVIGVTLMLSGGISTKKFRGIVGSILIAVSIATFFLAQRHVNDAEVARHQAVQDAIETQLHVTVAPDSVDSLPAALDGPTDLTLRVDGTDTNCLIMPVSHTGDTYTMLATCDDTALPRYTE